MSKLLEKLEERVYGWVEAATQCPAIPSDIEQMRARPFYGRQHYNNEKLKKIGGASVQFEAKEILGLAIGEFVCLQRFLRNQTLGKTEKMHPQISLVVLQRQTKIYSPYNTLSHERQHLEEARFLGRPLAMSLTMYQSAAYGQYIIGLAGEAVSECLTFKDKALVSSAPEALTAVDIDNARLYAIQSEDRSFQRLIEDRISRKKSMDRIYL